MSKRLPYSVKEVAQMYGLSPDYIRKEIHSGRLKASHKRGCTKLWYITESALDEWAENLLEEA